MEKDSSRYYDICELQKNIRSSSFYYFFKIHSSPVTFSRHSASSMLTTAETVRFAGAESCDAVIVRPAMGERERERDRE